MNPVIARPRRGRWVSKIAHPSVCAVITRSHVDTLVTAEKLLGWPTYTSWQAPTPRGAA